MEEILQLEKSILSYETELSLEGDRFSFVKELSKGNYLSLLQSSSCRSIFIRAFETYSPDEPLEDIFLRGALQYLDECAADLDKALHLLCVGVAALSAWQQENWTGPHLLLDEGSDALSWLPHLYPDLVRKSTTALERPLEGDVCLLVEQPTLLLFARSVLRACSESNSLKSGGWWWLRTLFTHQQLLVEPCALLYEDMSPFLENGPPAVLAPVGSSAYTLLNLEIARIYLWYGHITQTRNFVMSAQESSGLKLELIGALGKRTRFQKQDLPQLVLKVEVEQEQGGQQNIANCLPKDMNLNDEIRLERIQLADGEDVQTALLTAEQQAVVMGAFAVNQKAQPRDDLANEELVPYLQYVLAAPQWWSIQASALFHRSKLEGRNRRTIERAMMQMQELESAADHSQPGPVHRLRGIYCSHLPPRVVIQTELANLLISLGCVQSALDIYLRLRDWEKAVACYTLLQLRHKAAELLKRELAEKESVPLLCLLGDATDDEEHYARAWELSGGRSARAQRHWGLHHFKWKKYEESIPHLKKSLECNSLQPDLWLRLGYAALECEDWELCASAYRRYSALNPDNLEAWNNLAKAYVKTGQKARAWRALQEALKADFENWKLWDNVLAVSTDCGAFDEVLRAYHRLLDLRDGRHVDLPVLEVLVQAVSQNLPDNAGEGASRLRPQVLALFGRLTSKVCGDPSLWRLYAELNSSIPDQTQQTLERTSQYLQRAHRYATQANNWTREEKPCRDVLKLCSRLADAYMQCARACENSELTTRLLSSGRLSLKGVLSRVQQQRELAELVADEVQNLQEKLVLLDQLTSSLLL